MSQYAFCCNEEEEAKWMSTVTQVDDGVVHVVHIRYVILIKSLYQIQCSNWLLFRFRWKK